MKRLLHATHPEPKFWEVSVEGEVITLRTGPMHTPGTTRTIPTKSPQAALQTAQAMVEQRLRDGFREVQPGAHQTAEVGEALENERALLAKDDPDAWLVFADSLLETTERLRGELISLQVRAAKRERGAVGKAKAFVKEHFDALVGADLAGWHKQVTLDWKFGYARVARVWSGPHNAPIGEVLEAVLQSPACRFLKELQFGSPGNEGRYDGALRTLVKLPWPRHLDALFLGNFDVEAARAAQSAWPRVESLASLSLKAPGEDDVTQHGGRLRALDVRAALNTLGKGLRFPNLERLVLLPSALDARLATDLLTLEAPKLKTFGLGCPEQPRTGWDVWARFVRQAQKLTGLRTLVLDGQNDAIGMLEALGEDALRGLERVELVDAVTVGEAARLKALGPWLKDTVLALGDAPTLAQRLGPGFKLDTGEAPARAPKSTRRPLATRARPVVEFEDGDRYDDVAE